MEYDPQRYCSVCDEQGARKVDADWFCPECIELFFGEVEDEEEVERDQGG